ncbi:MAG: creatininase family protein [Rikenellaceae bacterium]|jgi:creatinine amidohydrolase
MKSSELEKITWKSVNNRNIKIALLPWGATEAHNLHLPYGTDTLLAEKVATEAAEIANQSNAGAIVLPSIAYGVNSGQMDIKLCLNMRPSTQMAILDDILTDLNKHSINKLVIINAHGGNSFVPIIREMSLKYPTIMICNINWWLVCKPENYFDEPGDHAGELETSVMQYIYPDLVLPLEEAGTGEENQFTIEGLKDKWAWTPRKWIYATTDTGVGNPSKSTPDKGEKFFNDCVNKISKFIIEFSSVNSEKNLYEKRK